MNDPKILELQERQTWLERDLEELNAVVARQHDLLERLSQEVEELRAASRSGADGEPERRTLEDDRPPHY